MVWRTAHGSLFRLLCACARLRRASRVVTRLYNRELRADGIEITQFTVLMALDQTGEIAQGELGKLLGLDSTTLTRMLRLLERRAWVGREIGTDRRQHLWRLTPAGLKRLNESRPHWERAQERLRVVLGEAVWQQMTEVLAEMSRRSAGADFFSRR